MVIAACVGEGFSCRVMLLSLSSHWTVTVLSLEIFANMDRKMLQLSSSGSRGKQILLAVTVGPRNQSPIINIARRERPRRRNCIHIDGSSRAVEFCTLFRGDGHSTLRLKGCRPGVAIFNSMAFMDIMEHDARTKFSQPSHELSAFPVLLCSGTGTGCRKMDRWKTLSIY